MRTPIWMVVLALTALPLAAVAAPSPAGALVPGALTLTPLVGAAPAGFGASLAPEVALATPFVGGIGYRPRGMRQERVMPTTTQIHVGFFSPTDHFGTGFDGGVRIGPQVDPNVQIGVAMDWWHKGDNRGVDLGPGSIPGSTLHRDLATSDADLVPMLAFVQVSGDENMSIVPYGGAGLGYEWLFLSGTGTDQFGPYQYDATYGGFGWQVWLGAALPLSGRTRMNGEVFYNGSQVGRDVSDFDANYRETVDVNGVGMRFGLSWGF